MKVTIMKKQNKTKKNRVRLFKTWVGIFRVGIFWENFPRGGIHQGGSLLGGNFPGGSFPDTLLH